MSLYNDNPIVVMLINYEKLRNRKEKREKREEKRKEIVENIEQLLISGANVNQLIINQYEEETTPFIEMLISSRFLDERIIDLMFHYNNDINFQLPSSGMTALHFALDNCSMKIIHKLVQLKSDFNIVDRYGFSVITYMKIKDKRAFDNLIQDFEKSKLVSKDFSGDRTLDLETEKQKSYIQEQKSYIQEQKLYIQETIQYIENGGLNAKDFQSDDSLSLKITKMYDCLKKF